jgi:XisI protein
MEILERISNDVTDRWRETLEAILRVYIEVLNLDAAIAVYLLISQDRNHYMLMHEGWQGDQRFHGPIVHAEMRDEKIWIHYDGTEAGITDELVATGVPKDHIVLAFQPPYARQHTGYAIG